MQRNPRRTKRVTLRDVAKHAGASEAKVSLLGRESGVILTISDNGKGFSTRAVPPNSLGLNIMRERAREIGAALSVRGQPGKGAVVKVTWSNTGENEDG